MLPRFNITAVEISYLYAIYSIPNFVFAPLFSYLLNFSGLGLGSLLLNIILLCSCITLYLGCMWDNFALVVIGRALFGIGAESLIVAQASMAERWFTGQFLSLAIGLNNVINMSGSAIAAWLLPEIFVYKKDLLVVVKYMLLVCMFSLVVNIVYWFLERKLVKQEADQEKGQAQGQKV